MKILFFDDFRLGVLKDDVVVDVTAAVKDVPHLGPHDLINGVIANFDKYRDRMEQAAGRGRAIAARQGRRSVRRCRARSISTAWRSTTWRTAPARKPAPINAFLKSPNCVLRTGDTMVLPDVPATHFEGEAELAVVIGKRGYQIKAADAMSYVFGYTNFIDGSARGLKPPGNTFYQMKSRDTFAPIGPYIVTADEIKDPHKLQVRLWNNGELKQNYNTDDMANKIPRCIEFVQLDPCAGAGRHAGDRHQSPRPARLPGRRQDRARDRRARPACASTCATTSSAPGRATRGWSGETKGKGDTRRSYRPLRADAGQQDTSRTDKALPRRAAGFSWPPNGAASAQHADDRADQAGRERARHDRFQARATRCRRGARAPWSPCRRS